MVEFPDVVVIGAGAVGLSVAYELGRRGATVTVLDGGAEPGAGCSHANAGLLAPSHVEPLATPANVVAGLRYMLRPASPFYVSPDPRLVPFLLRFAASAAPTRVRLLTRRMHELATRSLELHADYAAAGLTTSFERVGMMDLFTTSAGLAAARREVAASGDPSPRRWLSPAAVRTEQPLLGELSGALLREDHAHCDSLEFVTSMAAAVEAQGGEIRWGAAVRRLHSRAGRIVSVDTAEGALRAGTVVIAAGMGAERLARSAGLRLPMRAGKGYVVDVETTGEVPDVPMLANEDRVVITPYPGFLRLSGTLEFSSGRQHISERRVQAIRDSVARLLPSLSISRTRQVWAGERPCTADGVPTIGASNRHRNLVLAAGHAMWGLTLGPVTGELIAEGVLEGAPTLHEAAFAADRFGHVRAD